MSRKSEYEDRRQSRVSRASIAISDADVENDEKPSNKYKKLAKKLSEDKAELKAKIKEITHQTDAKVKEHRFELEKAQNYYTEQINELTEQISRVREERDKTREHYEDKITRLKETLEKKTSQREAQAKAMINSLSDKLTAQSDDAERNKEIAEQYAAKREEQLRMQIAQLEESLRMVKEQHMRDRKDIQALAKSYADEKEQYMLALRKEKDEEIKNISADKNLAVSTLQNIREQLEKRNKIVEKQAEESVNNMKYELEKVKMEQERKTLEITMQSKKIVEEIKTEYEVKSSELNRIHKLALETLKKENDEKFSSYDSETRKRIENHSYVLTSENNELKKDKRKLMMDIENLNKQFAEETIKRDSDIKKQYELELGRVLSELKVKYESREKEFQLNILNFQKALGEQQEVNHRLKESLAQVQYNLKKAQESHQSIVNQNLTSYNTIKESLESQLEEKSKTISNMEKNMRKINDDALERVSIVDRKYRAMSEEVKEMIDKNNNQKLALEKLEQYKNQQKEVIDRETEKVKYLTSDKDVLEKKINGLEIEVKNREIELNRAKNELTKSSITEGKLREEVKKANDEVRVQQHEKTNILKEKSSLETTLKNKDSVIDRQVKEIERANTAENKAKQEAKKIMEEKEAITAQLNARLSDVETLVKIRQNLETGYTSLSEKYKDITDKYEKLQESTNLTIASLKNDLTNVLNNTDQYKTQVEAKYSDEFKDKLRQVNEEKQKREIETSHTITKLEKQIHSLETNLESALQNIKILNSDIRRKDDELLKSKLTTKDVEYKDEHINALQLQIQAIKAEHMNGLNRINEEMKKDKELIIKYRTQVEQLNEKDLELQKYKISLMNTSKQYNSTLSKISNECKEQVEESKHKLAESQKALEIAKKQIEEIHAQHNKDLESIRRLPPADAKRLEKLEADNAELSMQCSMFEKNVKYLQEELINSQANYKAKMESLNKKEGELKIQAEMLNNTPPKLLDPEIKKSRDEAFAELRKAKIEIAELREQIQKQNKPDTNDQT